MKFKWVPFPVVMLPKKYAKEIGSTADNRGACVAKSWQSMRQYSFLNGDG
jgi:hypothetical protein